MQLHVYALPPIDFWGGWSSVEDATTQWGGSRLIERWRYERVLAEAFVLASDAGWEGDIREGPFIAGLPHEHAGGKPVFMIAWKQDNNGTTFVASPVQLPHLVVDSYAIVAGAIEDLEI